MKPCVLEDLAAFVRRYLSYQKTGRDMMHGYYVGVLTLQPVTLVGPAPDSRFAATSDLVVGKHGAEDSASQKALWHARVAASLFARHCLR